MCHDYRDLEERNAFIITFSGSWRKRFVHYSHGLLTALRNAIISTMVYRISTQSC